MAREGAGREGAADAPLVAAMSYTDASRELDEIVAFFEGREVDVDQLVTKLERASAIVEELDRRLRRTRAQVEELVPRLAAAAGGVAGDEDRVEEDDDLEEAELAEADLLVEEIEEVVEEVVEEAVEEAAGGTAGRRRAAPGTADAPGLF